MARRHPLSVAEARAIVREAEVRSQVADEQDVRFLSDMIPRHEATVAMAVAYLDNSDAASRDPRVAAMAEDIIEDQSGDIALMQMWLGVSADPDSDAD